MKADRGLAGSKSSTFEDAARTAEPLKICLATLARTVDGSQGWTNSPIHDACCPRIDAPVAQSRPAFVWCTRL